MTFKPTVFVVTSEHPFMLGTRAHVFATKKAADKLAAEIANVIRNDSPDARAPRATADNWKPTVDALQKYHSDRDMYVEVEETEVEDAEPIKLYTLAEIRSGTGFARRARFALVNENNISGEPTGPWYCI